MATSHAAIPGDERYDRLVDLGLSALLVLQGFTLFVAIPLGGGSMAGRMLLDACHLIFALICIGVLTRHRLVQAGLFASLVVLVIGPVVGSRFGANLHLGSAAQHEAIALVAFAFNGGVTAVVARHVFAPGRVTVHRVRGAVLLYLNVAALFAIAYGFLAMDIPGSFIASRVATSATNSPFGTAGFSYFSLATITTTGYGDIVPVDPFARSLANLEAVIGQLFPATLLTRLVSLHIAGGRE